jgi:acid phosphatase family membrane protein YuiD
MIFDDITNYYFWSVFIAWLISCIIKITINSIRHKKINISAGFENGGMPSSHAALMGSITFALLLEQGLTPIFFLALVISTLILRDAVTVRREVGLIGEAVNKILKKNKEKELKVIYGHTPMQVLIGLIIGIMSSVIFYLL